MVFNGKPTQKRRWRPTIGIRTKVLIAFIVLPLVSIAAFGYFALSDTRKTASTPS